MKRRASGLGIVSLVAVILAVITDVEITLTHVLLLLIFSAVNNLAMGDDDRRRKRLWMGTGKIPPVTDDIWKRGGTGGP